MPARYIIQIDGITYDVTASGRAKACEQGVRAHTGYEGRVTVTFTRYVSGAVVYTIETADQRVYEVIVIQ